MSVCELVSLPKTLNKFLMKLSCESYSKMFDKFQFFSIQICDEVHFT